jgi:hypothetical protein
MSPKPLLFVKRPAQGFKIPPTPHSGSAMTKLGQGEHLDVGRQTRYFFFSVFYLLLGLLLSQSGNGFLWLVGGFVLLAAMRGFYESRMLVKTTCSMLYSTYERKPNTQKTKDP